MDEALVEQLDGIADQVARRYSARVWWADRADLKQQAWSVALEVLREYPPLDNEGGLDRVALGGWAHRAASRQLSRYLWRQSSPVSASDHDVKSLAGVFHLELDGLQPATSEPVDELLAQHELRGMLHARALELGAGIPRIWVEAAMEVLLLGESPGDVARKLGLPSMELYRYIAWLKYKSCNDDKMRELCRQLSQGG